MEPENTDTTIIRGSPQPEFLGQSRRSRRFTQFWQNLITTGLGSFFPLQVAALLLTIVFEIYSEKILA